MWVVFFGGLLLRSKHVIYERGVETRREIYTKLIRSLGFGNVREGVTLRRSRCTTLQKYSHKEKERERVRF